MEQVAGNFIDKVYRGQVKLWKVFWFGYFLPKIPLIITVKIFQESPSLRDHWFSYVVMGIILLYEIWIGIGLFMCAPNVKHRVWFWLGRVIAIIILLTVLLSILKMLTH